MNILYSFEILAIIVVLGGIVFIIYDQNKKNNMAKFETLESLISEVGFDKVLKEGGENMSKFTLILGDFIVMISTPKEEVEVYIVSIFQNRDVIFQDWFHNQLFVPQLKEFIELYKNK